MTTRLRDHVVPADLPAAAEIVAAWADAHPHVWRACIIGSRVRGDHRPDSDLDVVVQPPPGGMSAEGLRWWLAARESDDATAAVFMSLRESVRPLALHLSHAP